MKGRAAAAAVLAGIPAAALGLVVGRAADRLTAAPRRGPGEEGLAGAVDRLGGEVVRLRSRDGLQLGGRWLPAEAAVDPTEGEAAWHPDPHEAVILLHGWTGSVAPDLVELGPMLRRTAGVLGLDTRGHGASADGPTTFGFLEVEDVAGALAWLGERGVTRVGFVGSSMGADIALASVAILGDGSLAAADADPDAPVSPEPAPRPRIVAVVADSATPELTLPVAARLHGLPGPVALLAASAAFRVAGRRFGGDIRAAEPIRIIDLVAPVPILLVHGEADELVPVKAARRLAAASIPGPELWAVPGAGHGEAHRTDPSGYDTRVTAFLRGAFAAARPATPIIASGTTEADPDAT